jgi:SAM-dependent methyltransferase
MSPASAVVWHDLECGGYGEDLGLWRELAAGVRGPVLDIGCGTGRIALDLAHRGHTVVALDSDRALLDALEERAAGLPVTTACADARDFALEMRHFALVLVPMQTIQLLGGAQGRAALLRCARAHLAPAGLFAAALADAMEGFDEDHLYPPLPDIREVDGVVYASRPVAVRDEGASVAIERIRETVGRDGRRTADGNVIRLDRLDAATLEREAEAAGFTALPVRVVPATHEYVASTVVLLRA